jgi:DNA-binding MarR family transcriptional regulator
MLVLVKTMAGLTLDRFLPYRLSVASNAVSNRIAQSYRKRFGLKVPEWRLIAILAEHDRLTPQALGRLTRMDKITVSRAASALAERGLIGSNRNPGDGRSHFLALTLDGQSLYAEIAPLARSLERELLAELSTEERAQLETLLRRIERAALAPDDPSQD